jgi:hypothetical protein
MKRPPGYCLFVKIRSLISRMLRNNPRPAKVAPAPSPIMTRPGWITSYSRLVVISCLPRVDFQRPSAYFLYGALTAPLPGSHCLSSRPQDNHGPERFSGGVWPGNIRYFLGNYLEFLLEDRSRMNSTPSSGGRRQPFRRPVS